MIIPEISNRSFIRSVEGNEWLEAHPSFVTLVGGFCTTGVEAENCFAGNRFIAGGDNSRVYDIDHIAVKVSTSTTGHDWHKQDGSIKPEDLVSQFKFLSALEKHLEGRDDINVPKQFFALNSAAGNIRGEEYMEGWQSLGSAAVDRGYSTHQKIALKAEVKSRVSEAIGPIFSQGLDFGKRLYCSNVLVPNDTARPESGPLCIIDQPANGLVGASLAALFIAKTLHNQKSYA
jgi:hypothetical protein